MEVSTPQFKVMSLFAEDLPIAIFTFNGHIVEQVDTFNYLGLHCHRFGDIVHLVKPSKAKAAGSSAAVQRRRSLLSCWGTVEIHLPSLQSILVPALHCGCEVWGMRSPTMPSAKEARADLQRVYE